MDVETLKKEMQEAWRPGHTFEKTIHPVLAGELYTLPIPSYVYAQIKREVISAAAGLRNKIYRHRGETPPSSVMDQGLKGQLQYVWRYRALLRKQKRLSFWKAYSGLSEEVIRAVAADNGFKFAREIIEETERRKKYNRGRYRMECRIMYQKMETVYFWDEVKEELTNWVEGDPLKQFGFLLQYGRGRRTVFCMARTLRHAECILLNHYGKSLFVVSRISGNRQTGAAEVLQPGETGYAFQKAGRVAGNRGGKRTAPGIERFTPHFEHETGTVGGNTVAENTGDRGGENAEKSEDLHTGDTGTEIEIM